MTKREIGVIVLSLFTLLAIVLFAFKKGAFGVYPVIGNEQALSSVILKAVTNQDPEICSKITRMPSEYLVYWIGFESVEIMPQRERCYIEVAKAALEPKICERIYADPSFLYFEQGAVRRCQKSFLQPK